MQTSCTIQRGFGFTTNIVGVVPCPPRAPRSLKQLRCITRTSLGLGDLENHLIAKHLEHDVNARGGYEVTPMHAAVSVGHVNILSLLSEHGADVNGRRVRDTSSLQ
jgi:ankyrin repeat protein